jgi:hypothetical protein
MHHNYHLRKQNTTTADDSGNAPWLWAVRMPTSRLPEALASFSGGFNDSEDFPVCR